MYVRRSTVWCALFMMMIFTICLAYVEITGYSFSEHMKNASYRVETSEEAEEIAEEYLGYNEVETETESLYEESLTNIPLNDPMLSQNNAYNEFY